MSTSAFDQSALPAASASPLMFGVLGTLVSVIGPVTLYSGYTNSGWSAVSVIIGILLCGVAGVFCGVSSRSSILKAGKSLPSGARLLSGFSIIGGSFAIGVVLLIAMVLGLLMVLSPR